MTKRKLNLDLILKYYKKIVDDDNHRYKSWEHCYNAFNKVKNKEILSLHLSFYLASWGMYRGSSGLLQKDYLIHKGAISLIHQKKYARLRCSKTNEVSVLDIPLILLLISDLKKYYESHIFSSKNGQKKIKATTTLISKVLLGTLGCVPAFDRYFIDGAKKCNLNFKNLNQISLKKLFDFIKDNHSSLIKIQRLICTTKTYYSVMKVLDMYFWQTGFGKS